MEHEKIVAQKKLQQSCCFVLLMLDIDKAHADNAECHHKPLVVSIRFHAS